MPTLDPALFANAVVVEAYDIPVDMTIDEWRRKRPTTRPRRRRFLFF